MWTTAQGWAVTTKVLKHSLTNSRQNDHMTQQSHRVSGQKSSESGLVGTLTHSSSSRLTIMKLLKGQHNGYAKDFCMSKLPGLMPNPTINNNEVVGTT